MNQKVNLSTYSLILSAICPILLLVCLYYCGNNWGGYTIGVIIIAYMCLTLFYMPLKISADERELSIHRSLRIKSIPLSEIQRIELCAPTLAEKKLCASGGFFGYWGWFSEPSIGTYFAYYGKASDCFLIELKNGKKYIIGCENAPDMVQYISKRI